MNILDKNFKYTNAASTDIRKTFARIKKELNLPKNKNLDKPLVAESPLVVKTLKDFDSVLGPR